MPVSRQRDGNDVTLISVQAFTPILGTLLLSPNGMVSGPARCTVVELLCRIRKADDAEESKSTNAQPPESTRGLFEPTQRQMFEEELIHQLVIGIGRLDASVEDEEVAEIWYDATARTPAGELPEGRHCTSSSMAGDQTSVNPYFPPASHESPTSSPTATTSGSFLSSSLSVPLFQLTPELSFGDPSPMVGTPFLSEPTLCMLPTAESHTDFETRLLNGIPHPDHRPARQGAGDADEDLDPGEQAAVGRLSSMSLIAAVAAGGMSYTRHFIYSPSTIICRLGSLRLDAQRAFVREVERAGRDPVHWVRREASFALGALVKVIPEELVVSALVRVVYVPILVNASKIFLSFRYSKRYAKIRSGTFVILPYLHCQPYFPDSLPLYGVLLRFQLLCHSPGTNPPLFALGFSKPLVRYCTPSMQTNAAHQTNYFRYFSDVRKINQFLGPWLLVSLFPFPFHFPHFPLVRHIIPFCQVTDGVSQLLN